MSAQRTAMPRLAFDRRAIDRLVGHASSNAERRLAVFALVLTVALLGALAVRQELQFQAARRTNIDLASALAKAQAPQTQMAKAIAVQRAPSTAADLREENMARHMLNLPWSDILDGLERHASPDVGLTVLEPDGALGRLNVQAEARNVDVLLRYAQQLAADRSFGPLVLRQQATNETDPNRPVRLSFGVRLAAPPSAEVRP